MEWIGVYDSVAEVQFGLVFVLSGETGNRTAGSVQHIAQTGTGTTMNGSDRFGLHLNQVQTWNCWPSGFWPHESSTHIYWCCVHCCKVDCKGAAVNVNSCVDQIRAVTPRITCRSNGLDLRGFSCSGFARRSNRLNLQGFWNLNSRHETAHGSSGLNRIQMWFCNSTVARTANQTCSSVPWSCWTWTELLVRFGVWTGFAPVLNQTSATLVYDVVSEVSWWMCPR